MMKLTWTSRTQNFWDEAALTSRIEMGAAIKLDVKSNLCIHDRIYGTGIFIRAFGEFFYEIN